MDAHQLTREIPAYLHPYIAKQDPSLYTFIDHSSWRFIRKLSRAYFAKHAHQKYQDGLKETGISSETIPLISEMDRCLSRFNWRAVPVTGFIPPAVFMEFLSLGVLPIACDMRTLAHLAYTPAPDIVHEAAGHAPIIADPEYADYLRSYGEISQKAIFSRQDMDVYQAIRSLSDIKENPESTVAVIEMAQENLNRALAEQTYESEATLLARMGWWTFEYGLVGSIDQPKIFGAGLLSSVHESFHCLTDKVKKIPFSIDCIYVSYDITQPQPQLFVTPDFQTLKDALQELGDRMAFRRGGMEGLEKAKLAGATTTTVLNSGIQISGTLVKILQNGKGQSIYLQFEGPCQLSYQGRELEGQGAKFHREGFGTPLIQVSESMLANAHLGLGKSGILHLDSGITVEGKLTQILKKEGSIILLTFENCTVKKGAEILFRPEWGKYDMACGQKVVSVFGGAADRQRYLEDTGGFDQEPGQQKTNLTSENRELNELYSQVRKIRDSRVWDSQAIQNLTQVHQKLDQSYPQDWLLRYELLELSVTQGLKFPWEKSLYDRIDQIIKISPEMAETIRRGMELL